MSRSAQEESRRGAARQVGGELGGLFQAVGEVPRQRVQVVGDLEGHARREAHTERRRGGIEDDRLQGRLADRHAQAGGNG